MAKPGKKRKATIRFDWECPGCMGNNRGTEVDKPGHYRPTTQWVTCEHCDSEIEMKVFTKSVNPPTVAYMPLDIIINEEGRARVLELLQKTNPTQEVGKQKETQDADNNSNLNG